MKYFIPIILLLILSCGVHKKYEPNNENIKLEKHDRFISNETLKYTLAVGYEKRITNRKQLEIDLDIAIAYIKREINVEFIIIQDKEVELDSQEGRLRVFDCSMQLKPELEERHNHINLCFVHNMVQEPDTLGIYTHDLGISLVSSTPNSYVNINTIKHELGHFLGADHSNKGIMQANLPENITKRVFKYDKPSIKQIRDKQLK